MRSKIFKKWLALFTISLLSCLVICSSVNAGDRQNIEKTIQIKSASCEIINITVFEAWDLLTDTSNGIQHPIDVRYDYEWYAGFIDTPYPENPHWYTLDLLKNETGLQEFIDIYDGEEVIFYCKGGYRSLYASNIVCHTNFTGTIYNMLGGYMEWVAQGLPTRINTPPEEPLIDGPKTGRILQELDYSFNTSDAEDDIVYYYIQWSDDGSGSEWQGPYASGEEVIFSHKWDKRGTHTIKAKAKDFYGNESDLAEFDVIITFNKALKNYIIDKFIERFPNAISILRFLLKF